MIFFFVFLLPSHTHLHLVLISMSHRLVPSFFTLFLKNCGIQVFGIECAPLTLDILIYNTIYYYLLFIHPPSLSPAPKMSRKIESSFVLYI